MDSSLTPITLSNGDAVVGVVQDGETIGTTSEVRVFRGIEFAEPPVGQYRFRPAVAKVGSATIHLADTFGPIAPQTPGLLESAFGADSPEFDEARCLTLNVWASTDAIEHASNGASDGAVADALSGTRPVMVWIHGGAYLTGSGSTPWYDGSRFAGNGDVIVVTINYRLGALGYLSHPDLAGSGNAGLSDQLLALQWVHDNIAAFGGDPARVTVFGESAGAFSVTALLAMPGAKGLIHRAILQSGAGAHTWPADKSHAVTKSFMQAANISDVSQLSTLSVTQILDAQNAVIGAGEHGGLPFQPTHGTDLLPLTPFDAIRSRTGANVSAVLHGTNRDEFRLFTAFDPSVASLNDEGLAQRLAGRFNSEHFDSEHSANVLATYRGLHPEATPGQIWSAIETDTVFRQPAQQLADALRESATPSWQYLFAWPTTAFGGGLGSCHALEIPFVFDALHQRAVDMFVGNDETLEDLAIHMHEAWTWFAQGQAPLEDWPAEDERRPVYQFHNDGSEGLKFDPFAAERSVWF